jgi:hypothetical protein
MQIFHYAHVLRHSGSYAPLLRSLSLRQVAAATAAAASRTPLMIEERQNYSYFSATTTSGSVVGCNRDLFLEATE